MGSVGGSEREHEGPGPVKVWQTGCHVGEGGGREASVTPVLVSPPLRALLNLPVCLGLPWAVRSFSLVEEGGLVPTLDRE